MLISSFSQVSKAWSAGNLRKLLRSRSNRKLARSQSGPRPEGAREAPEALCHDLSALKRALGSTCIVQETVTVCTDHSLIHAASSFGIATMSRCAILDF